LRVLGLRVASEQVLTWVLLSERWRGDIEGEEDGSVAEVGVVDVVDVVGRCRRRMRGR
jgi:hypothetical protein